MHSKKSAEKSAEITGEEAIKAALGIPPLSLVEKPEQEPKKDIVLYLRDGMKGVERNFTKYPNDIHTVMASLLKEASEAVLYMYLWRQSWGYGRNYCRTSYARVYRETNIGSTRTAQRAMDSLIQMHFVVRRLLEDGSRDFDNTGSLYRVITPAEIQENQTEEGVILDDIPLEGIVMVSIDNMSIPDKPTEEDIPQGIDTMAIDTMSYSHNGYSHNDQGSIDTMAIDTMTKPEAKPEKTSDPADPRQNDYSHSVYPLKEDSFKDSLSLSKVTDIFYTSIGQPKVSKEKRERAERVVEELLADGFTLEDIAFAAEWTTANAKEKPYDFSLLKHTIGEAISHKRDIQERQVREQEAARVVAAEKEAARQEEQRLAALKAQKESLGPDERAALRRQAEDDIRRSGQFRPEFVTEALIEAKENEILSGEIAMTAQCDE
jgi:hypothetical protein